MRGYDKGGRYRPVGRRMILSLVLLVVIGAYLKTRGDGAAARVALASSLTRRGRRLAGTAQHAEVLEPAPPLVPVGPGHLVAEAER